MGRKKREKDDGKITYFMKHANEGVKFFGCSDTINPTALKEIVPSYLFSPFF